MKGFPNQINDLHKLARGMRCIVDCLDNGENPREDRVLGVALVRAGVAGTGHTPKPIHQYLREQQNLPVSRQSFRTTARGLRELYGIMGLIEETPNNVIVTSLGRRAAEFSTRPMDNAQKAFWRDVIYNMEHSDEEGASHPYRILLALVRESRNITGGKCALALEARDDSPAELTRIVRLARLPEEKIIESIGATPANWKNAKKVLLRFAEQVGDVVKGNGGTYTLSGTALKAIPTTKINGDNLKGDARASRGSRAVTSETIAIAGTANRADAPFPTIAPDPAAIAAAKKAQRERLTRHNKLVKRLTTKFELLGKLLMEIREDPFDILLLLRGTGYLVEVKTLDGTRADERDRVMDALSQLLYYRDFQAQLLVGERPLHMIACFEAAISKEHNKWLNGCGIGAIWEEGKAFNCDELAAEALGEHADCLN